MADLGLGGGGFTGFAPLPVVGKLFGSRFLDDSYVIHVDHFLSNI